MKRKKTRKSPNQFFLDIAIDPDELMVDFFAGGGGTSHGCAMATGKSPDVAINHWQLAIDVHAANHPATKHFREDIWQVHPRNLPAGRIALLWASPSCTHFSRARGGRPVSKQHRAQPWVVTRAAAVRQPRVIIVENVREFKDWGPVDQKTKKADPKRKGQTFRRWIKSFGDLGYTVEWRVLDAADYGAPTHRERFFLVARRDGLPIDWPEKTHGPGRKHPYRAAAEIIDWSQPSLSIFASREDARAWRKAVGADGVPKRPLAKPTERRVAEGIKRYVLGNPKPFLVQVNHGRDTNRSRGLDSPMPTISTKHGFGVVTPTLVTNNANNLPRSVEDPLRAITTGGRHLVVTSTLVRTAHGDVDKKGKRRGKGCHDVQEPLRTVAAGGTDHAVCEVKLVAPTMVQTGQGERKGQRPRALDIRAPLGVVVVCGQRHAVVLTELIQSAHLATFYGTSADGTVVTEPCPTVTGQGNHIALVSGVFAREPIDRADDVVRFLEAHLGREAIAPWVRQTTDGRECIAIEIQGVVHVMIDICLRMLQPHELAAAQGFPRDYILLGTKEERVGIIGNSVSPPQAAAVIRAQFRRPVEAAPAAAE